MVRRLPSCCLQEFVVCFTSCKHSVDIFFEEDKRVLVKAAGLCLVMLTCCICFFWIWIWRRALRSDLCSQFLYRAYCISYAIRFELFCGFVPSLGLGRQRSSYDLVGMSECFRVFESSLFFFFFAWEDCGHPASDRLGGGLLYPR